MMYESDEYQQWQITGNLTSRDLDVFIRMQVLAYGYESAFYGLPLKRY